jgi:hypothetical protein
LLRYVDEAFLLLCTPDISARTRLPTCNLFFPSSNIRSRTLFLSRPGDDERWGRPSSPRPDFGAT